MPHFSDASLEKLRECDGRLRDVMLEVVKHFDCTIVCGRRGKEEQDKAFADGKSKVQWPNGKHNSLPSMAVDVVPSPINWDDANQMRVFAGFVLGVAAMMGVPLRWGGDWDRDWDVAENRFNDFPHFEIKEEA